MKRLLEQEQTEGAENGDGIVADPDDRNNFVNLCNQRLECAVCQGKLHIVASRNSEERYVVTHSTTVIG